LSGGITQSDFVAGTTSARLTGHLTGTAIITIAHATLGTDQTGIITVAPAPATLTLSADTPILRIGSGVTTTMRAALRDAANAPVIDGVPVTFTIVSGGSVGTLPANPYVTTTLNGQATALFTGGLVTGTVTVEAATGGLKQQITVTLRPFEVFLPAVLR
jgi:hypothetical protein